MTTADEPTAADPPTKQHGDANADLVNARPDGTTEDDGSVDDGVGTDAGDVGER